MDVRPRSPDLRAASLGHGVQIFVTNAEAGKIKTIGAANANRIELEGAAAALAAKAQVKPSAALRFA